MYSVVLMAALTSGGDTSPDFLFRCRGCRGCSSCGCGCSGCHGCSGSCWGVWSGGMHGWSYGYGCVGCYGCAGYMAGYYGQGHGYAHGQPTAPGQAPAPGQAYAPYGYGHGYYPHNMYYACYGGWTCYGCAGQHRGPYPPTNAPTGPRMRPETDPNVPPDTGAQARVTLEVPADAKLFVDGVQTRQTSERRVFVTPPLEPGRAYYYEMRVEIVRDGRTLSETRQIVVRGGQTANTSFASLGNPNPGVQTVQSR